MLYSEVLLEAVRHPSCRGNISKMKIKISQNNPMCGDNLAVGLEIKAGKVVKILWQGQGCLVCCGSAEILCEACLGQKVSFVSKIKATRLFKMLGFRPTPSREICALLSLKALKAILNKVNSSRSSSRLAAPRSELRSTTGDPGSRQTF